MEKEIRKAINSEKIIIGYKRTLKSLKMGKVKLVILASNCPQNILDEIKRNANIAKVSVEKFKGNEIELGEICRKPFLISTLAIEK